MPIYDYLCAGCGAFEARRPMSESAEPAACPDCGAAAPRQVCAPLLNLMSSHDRYAETRNEKSAHEPDVIHTLSSQGRGHVHTAACRHHPQRPLGHAAKRPWMLGH